MINKKAPSGFIVFFVVIKTIIFKAFIGQIKIFKSVVKSDKQVLKSLLTYSGL